jgi:hypothetical protein
MLARPLFLTPTQGTCGTESTNGEWWPNNAYADRSISTVYLHVVVSPAADEDRLPTVQACSILVHKIPT